ncbi:hypothetical protein RCL_jg16129.t1 [Rhizophagus clarus]|uniref:Uncharacterized protein n=1 Tax=Rhizophagus clarus TaxID=94130 RepID=A0A8H3LD25_9GLOM|nr:hypothetical protein RCL_jg16129.t1 [Rhizophagus clarus]
MDFYDQINLLTTTDFLKDVLPQFAENLSSSQTTSQAIDSWISTSIHSTTLVNLLNCAATGKMNTAIFHQIQ